MIGQVPVVTSSLVTIKSSSRVQLSETETPNASNAATVLTAAGFAAMEHALIFVFAIVPVITGFSVSATDTVFSQEFSQCLSVVTVTDNLNEPQELPAFTVTSLVEAPERIEASPVISHA